MTLRRLRVRPTTQDSRRAGTSPRRETFDGTGEGDGQSRTFVSVGQWTNITFEHRGQEVKTRLFLSKSRGSKYNGSFVKER